MELREASTWMDYLLQCKKECLYNKKVLDVTSSILKLTFYSNMCRNKSKDLYNNVKKSVFKLFLSDIHIHINFLRRKIKSIYDRLAALVPDNLI